MVKLNYSLIKPNHITEILYSLSHKRANTIIALCPGERMKYFISMINANSCYRNIIPLTFNQYLEKQTQNTVTVFMINPPNTFEILTGVLKKSQSLGQDVILALLSENKKYINMIGKKVDNLQLNQLEYSSNKFVGINDKIREFVDKSYDMNRAGFYAYGQYINYYRANLLKNIFRTELINVDQLCRSFGFTSALRVKQGNFLKPAARKAKQAEKKAQKRKKKKESLLKQTQQAVEQPLQQQQIIHQSVKTKKSKVVNKTKKIVKKVLKKVTKNQNKVN